MKGFATVTIAQKDAVLNWSEASFTYNGTIQAPSAGVSNLVAGESCTVTVSGQQKAAGTGYTAEATALVPISLSRGIGTEAGTYTITADDNGADTNYAVTITGTGIYTISGHIDETVKGEATTCTKEAIENGQDARIFLSIENLFVHDIDASSKDKIVTAAEDALGENATINYMDISLYKQVGDGPAEKISEPGTRIEITIEIPRSMLIYKKKRA